MSNAFKSHRYNPVEWRDRAIAYLEANLDRFVKDTPEQAAMDSETYTFHYMMDASRQRYTLTTLAQLRKITNETNPADVLITEIRVDWACEYLKGIVPGDNRRKHKSQNNKGKK
jgi:hypothetical protein